MESREELQRKLEEVKREYGDFVFDIPLPFGLWTAGNQKLPDTRLKRVVQVVSDLSEKPLSECRILDLGCLDGIFSIEFALHGAETVGVEIRKDHIKRAIFCQEVLGLRNLEFRLDDVRNISLDSYGKFDAIVCSGILYHLPASDAIDLINCMYGMVNRVVVIDTHIALKPVRKFVKDGEDYWGSVYREHSDRATPDEKAKKLLSSADNPTSFWFTRPSLINIINKAGFSSVYECFSPIHLNFGRPGIEHLDRCTFTALKDEIPEISTSPSVNGLEEKWPEKSLTYGAAAARGKFLKRLISRLRRMVTRRTS